MQRNADGSALPGRLEETAAAVRTLGREVLLQQMDLLDSPSRDVLVAAAVERSGHIDVLVNNGIYQGKGLMADFLGGDLDDIDDAFEANVIAQLHLARLVLPHMFKQEGDMTSAAGMMDPPMPLAKGGWGFGHGRPRLRCTVWRECCNLNTASVRFARTTWSRGWCSPNPSSPAWQTRTSWNSGFPEHPLSFLLRSRLGSAATPKRRSSRGRMCMLNPSARGVASCLTGWSPKTGS
jgi:hypothetical protein